MKKWGAGVFMYDVAANRVLAVSRNGKPKGKKAPRVDFLDWGLPGGWGEPGETVPVAAARELWEETGLSIDPAALSPAMTIPSIVSGHRPFHVCVPLVQPAGPVPPFDKSIRGPEGYVRWMTLEQMTAIHDPSKSVAASNRFIFYQLLGLDVPLR